MLGLLASLGAAYCAWTIEPELGVKQYNIETKRGNTVCINSTVFPLTVIFSRYEKDTLYREYTYSLHNSSETSYETLMRFLPIHKTMTDPMHSVTITTPTATNLSFMTALLPGMCDNGMYISTLGMTNIVFTPDGEGFHKLNNYDDKCIIFGPQSNSTYVDISMTSEDREDQVLVYKSMTDYDIISGSGMYTEMFDGKNPVFIRIIADDKNPAQLIEMMFDFPEEARNPDWEIYVPSRLPQVCDISVGWCTEGVAVGIVAMTSMIGILVLTWICCTTVKQSMSDTRMHREDRGSGYYNIPRHLESERSLASCSLID